MAKKPTVQQARHARQAAAAATTAKVRPGADEIDMLLAQVNKDLAGNGRVTRGSDIEQRQYSRRSSGICSLDYVLNGGLPRGGLIELGGPYSSGKTATALEACANEQRTERGAIAWVALEPFDKRWARERGLWLPFSDKEQVDPDTGAARPIDPFDQASELEKHRMAEWGFEDPYSENGLRFVLVQEERGDVALDIAYKLLVSNLFSIIVVDSLGVARSTKWVDEGDVQSFSDFPREPKMIGDYTSRALLALNRRYDSNNKPSNDGQRYNQTTLIHINQIVTKVGTQAKAPWSLYEMKGGEANKHNHHAIVFCWRTADDDCFVELPGKKRYQYAQQCNYYCLKSKLGPPFRQGSARFFMQSYGPHKAGSFDVAEDVLTHAISTGVIQQQGSYYMIGEDRFHGRETAANHLRENPNILDWAYEEAMKLTRKLCTPRLSVPTYPRCCSTFPPVPSFP